MPGTLIPSWYRPTLPSEDDKTVVSIIWGISLGLSLFGFLRAGSQTYNQWRRTRRVTGYMTLIWVELVASTVLAAISWAYVYQIIPPSFEFFFFVLVLWVFQVHCIMQIIINRIALLAVSRTVIRRLKWGIFVFLALINISVFCIWIPSRLQISEDWRRINMVWDRIEKCLFALCDLCLNLYFVYLVRSSLVNYGLTKYVVLYRFNLAIIVVSIGMDILVISVMSLRNTFVYVIFHPLAYLVKLHIELWMATLIAKIVKATGPEITCNCACHHAHFPIRHDLIPPSRHNTQNSLAPTTGRFRRSWPIWPRRAQTDEEQNGDMIALRRPKIARTELFRSRPLSWIPRHQAKDSELGLSSTISSSFGRSSNCNDH